MARKIQDVDPEVEMKEAFRIFDKDGNGYISKEELKTLLKSIGEKMTDAQIQELLNSIDTSMLKTLLFAFFFFSVN